MSNGTGVYIKNYSNPNVYDYYIVHGATKDYFFVNSFYGASSFYSYNGYRVQGIYSANFESFTGNTYPTQSTNSIDSPSIAREIEIQVDDKLKGQSIGEGDSYSFDNASYYILKIDEDHVMLAASYSDFRARIPLKFESLGHASTQYRMIKTIEKLKKIEFVQHGYGYTKDFLMTLNGNLYENTRDENSLVQQTDTTITSNENTIGSLEYTALGFPYTNNISRTVLTTAAGQTVYFANYIPGVINIESTSTGGVSGSGNISVNAGETIVTGSGTSFTYDLVNYHIFVGTNYLGKVLDVISSTVLRLQYGAATSCLNSPFTYSGYSNLVNGTNYTATNGVTFTLTTAYSNSNTRLIVTSPLASANYTTYGDYACVIQRTVNPSTNSEPTYTDTTSTSTDRNVFKITLGPSTYTFSETFVDTSSFLSDNSYIQDSDYYQYYSYVVKTDMKLEEYSEMLKKYLHTSGFKVFGKEEINNTITVASIISSAETIV